MDYNTINNEISFLMLGLMYIPENEVEAMACSREEALKILEQVNHSMTHVSKLLIAARNENSGVMPEELQLSVNKFNKKVSELKRFKNRYNKIIKAANNKIMMEYVLRESKKEDGKVILMVNGKDVRDTHGK